LMGGGAAFFLPIAVTVRVTALAAARTGVAVAKPNATTGTPIYKRARLNQYVILMDPTPFLSSLVIRCGIR
jgi:hypothetical protein